MELEHFHNILSRRKKKEEKISVYVLIVASVVFHIFNNPKISFSYIEYNGLIGQVGRVIANGPGDLGSIPGCVIPKTLKMVLNTSLLNTQQYKVRIKGKVEQSKERSSALPYTSV